MPVFPAPTSRIPPVTGPAIRLAGTARFGTATLFRDAVLELLPGTWTCLLGPSGVGKSTALRLIAGLDTGADFQGDIKALDGSPLTGRVAYMAQSDLLLPWLDLRGNVALGARLRGSPPDWPRIDALIDRLGLAAHARKRPASLSGGQRQRTALARTLMENKAIVLLDEPFSALDARTRADMQDLAAETLAGRTVLMVTHDPGEAARLGARIYLMENNTLTQHPPPAGHPIRAIDDPEMLACQAALLLQLRAAT
ncbi:MAG: ABC transporter ATP-binding protein [Rhodobacteraceae bacterium]|nr:ABC transporter ATP-binding protein [Paracoccaceae bacterium]